MQDFLEAFLNWEIMREASPILWQGLRATLLLSLLVVPLGLLGGIILAVLSTLPHAWVRWPPRLGIEGLSGPGAGGTPGIARSSGTTTRSSAGLLVNRATLGNRVASAATTQPHKPCVRDLVSWGLAKP